MTNIEPTGNPQTDLSSGKKAMDDLFLRLPPEAENMIEFTQLTRVYRDANDEISVPPKVLYTWYATAIGRLELRIIELEREVAKLRGK